MKQRIKEILKIIFYISIVIFISIASLICYSYYKSFEKEEINSLAEEIKQAKQLPKKFIDAYSKVSPIINTKTIITKTIFHGYAGRINCPCFYLSNLLMINKFSNKKQWSRYDYSKNRFFLSIKLENEVTQTECLNYLTTKWDFLFNIKGIDSASKFYFEKSIDSLNQKEYLTLALMLDNPRKYNPKRKLSQRYLKRQFDRLLTKEKN